MRKPIVLLIVGVLLPAGCSSVQTKSSSADQDIADAFANQQSGLSVGDSVEFSGQYEWNDRGGVVHWTHHDLSGRHQARWLKDGGVTYQ